MFQILIYYLCQSIKVNKDKILIEKDENEKKDVILEIVKNRYCKVNKDITTIFTTRLVSKCGVYSCHPGKENYKLLEKAGFVEHEKCIPFLARSKGTITYKK